jgi:hypothetical protein
LASPWGWTRPRSNRPGNPDRVDGSRCPTRAP